MNLRRIAKAISITALSVSAIVLAPTHSLAIEDYLIETPLAIEIEENSIETTNLFEGNLPIVQAKEIFMNGISLGTFDKEVNIKDLVDQISLRYVSNIEEQTVEIKDLFEEKDAYKLQQEINSAADLTAKLMSGPMLETTLAFSEKELFSDFLEKLEISEERLRALNPEIDNLLEEDDDNLVFAEDGELIVEESSPIFEVHVYKDFESITEIEYNEIVEKDNSKYKNEKEVIQKGEVGEVKIITRKSTVNGIEIVDEVISMETVKSPVNKIIVVGTKTAGVATGKFMRPTSGRVSSEYGWRSMGWHGGIDIASNYGTNILASDGGVVIAVGYDGSYGNKIVIDHGNGLKTLYAHLSSFRVRVGDRVNKGQHIGEMGSTGRSTGNHLHFEVRVNDERVNPRRYVNI